MLLFDVQVIQRKHGNLEISTIIIVFLNILNNIIISNN